MSALSLYECEVDGSVTWWVAALNAFEAVDLLRTDMTLSFGDVKDVDMISVDDCPEEVVAKKWFTREDGTRIPLWEEFRSSEEPRVIACSVF